MRAVTAKEVAEAAGVSTATVSLVVNGRARGRVSAATAERVQTAVRRLGYRVDAVGRSLSTGVRRTVCLVAPDLTNPFYSAVTAGAITALGAGYQFVLVVSSVGREVFYENIEHAAALRPDGILVDAPSAELVREIRPVCPIVLLDAAGVAGATDFSVNIDVADGARKIGEHLIERRRTRVAYIGASTGTPTLLQRRHVLDQYINSTGGSRPGHHTTESAVDIDAAEEVVTAMWPRWERDGVDAIVCATDIQAYGVLKAARQLGISIPRRVVLAAFDDLPYSAIVSPSLTTVHLPAFELGFESATLLREIVRGERLSHQTLTLPVSLMARESTAI